MNTLVFEGLFIIQQVFGGNYGSKQVLVAHFKRLGQILAVGEPRFGAPALEAADKPSANHSGNESCGPIEFMQRRVF